MNDNTLMLERYRAWLEQAVLPGYAAREDNESIRRTQRQIANIDWQLTTGQPAPSCGWKKPYANHPANCHVCRINRERLGQ